MEVAQSWRLKFSFRNATIVVCFLNVLAALLLLQGFLSSSFSRSKISASQFNSGCHMLNIILPRLAAAGNICCEGFISLSMWYDTDST
uniref:Uncharacterized protein n=1 Tax=Quercus lobata TaxID=97700 RepID=A0A7N2R6H9_QUELO